MPGSLVQFRHSIVRSHSASQRSIRSAAIWLLSHCEVGNLVLTSSLSFENVPSLTGRRSVRTEVFGKLELLLDRRHSSSLVHFADVWFTSDDFKHACCQFSRFFYQPSLWRRIIIHCQTLVAKFATYARNYTGIMPTGTNFSMDVGTWIIYIICRPLVKVQRMFKMRISLQAMIMLLVCTRIRLLFVICTITLVILSSPMRTAYKFVARCPAGILWGALIHL